MSRDAGSADGVHAGEGDGFAAPVGYHAFHPDVSINFQCNRWHNWIGAESLREIGHLAGATGTDYEDWVTGFLRLASRCREAGREYAAAYYDRAADFFMESGDSRKQPARRRFLTTLRNMFGIDPVAIGFRSGAISAFDIPSIGEEIGTLVVFGGYDSYIEEFLPLLHRAARSGYRVIAFDGPGQGAALEDHGLGLTADWETPVAAVLDHFSVDDVTLIGISMGGGLAIRAAAFEPRVRRVVAYDVFDDAIDVLGRQVAPGAAWCLRALLRLRARGVLNRAVRIAAAREPVAEWGVNQGTRITGTDEPYEFLRVMSQIRTGDVSSRVRADVLLLAGADDHYVPVRQLARQAAALKNARSVTTRLFTAAESASNHCQIGNLDAFVGVLLAWEKQWRE